MLIRKERKTLVPFLLCHASMNCSGREFLLYQQLGQSNTTLHCFHKDHYLKKKKKITIQKE